MALVPMYGFLKGDTIGLLVLVQDHETVGDLAARLQQAATTRVAPVERLAVYYKGRRLNPDVTVAEAGMEALDRVDVVPEPLS